MTAEYIYKTCCPWQCNFGVKHFLFADLFLSYFVPHCLCFHILSIKSFRLMEQCKQIIGKLTCIKCDIFQEEQITGNTTLLRIKLAGGFESNTQSASKRKESSIKSLLRAPWKHLIKSCGQRKSSNPLSDPTTHQNMFMHKLTMAAALWKNLILAFPDQNNSFKISF